MNDSAVPHPSLPSADAASAVDAATAEQTASDPALTSVAQTTAEATESSTLTESPSDSPTSEPQANARAQVAKQKKAQHPRGNGPHPALVKLFDFYPALFGARFVPLKLGVFQELMARHPDDFKKDELKVAMGLHARSTRYLESVAAGHPRHDLEGQPVEPVAPEHVHHAILEIHRRRQQRSRFDLSTELRTRLARAIDESGIDRETYAERTRTQDEAHNALLDEAMAEHAALVAKREALLRAYEASGKNTEAEFAEMYGMDTGEVTRLLQRARVVPAPKQAPASASEQPPAEELTMPTPESTQSN